LSADSRTSDRGGGQHDLSRPSSMSMDPKLQAGLSKDEVLEVLNGKSARVKSHAGNKSKENYDWEKEARKRLLIQNFEENLQDQPLISLF